MHSSIRHAFFSPLALLVLAVACSDASRPAVDPVSTETFGAILPAGCDYNTVKRDARNYLSTNDTILVVYRDMQSAARDGDQALVTTKGFDALRRLAQGRNTGIGRAASDGAKAAIGTLTCMGAAPLPGLVELTGAFDLGANGGIFEVRGGAIDPSGPALSPPAVVPAWGAEPQAGQTWLTSLGTRALLWAYRIAFTSFSQETPALLNPGATDEFGTAFQLTTVPTLTPVVPLLVGVCVDNPDRYRLQHVNTILALQSLSFCSGATSMRPDEAGHGLLAAVHRVVDWIAPSPLYAASTMFIGGTGGLPSGFSPFGAVDVAAANIALTIDPILNGNTSTPVTITVRAKSAKGNPVDNVLIRLSVDGNNGLGPDGTFELLGVQQPTANGGIATFVVTLDKAGGYRIRADGYFNQNDVLPTLSAVSNLFNIQGK